jgi:staphylococcal nuclease domain-containing protein 1
MGRLFINKDKDVACEMLANGYAKLPKQTGSMEPEYYAKLRIAMHQAQVGRKGLWKDEAKGTEAEEVKGANFTGRVTEIQSGDSLTVMNTATGEEKRYFLAGVRAPTLATKANPEKEQPYAWEAKDFARRMVIGKTVEVEIEYSKVPGKPDEEPSEPKKPAMTFVNVLFGGKCLNVEIVAAGLASVVNPPLDKVLSKYYGEMVAAAKKAKDTKKGINSVGNHPVHTLQDMYGQTNQKTIAYYQEFFSKNRRVTGMVEHCITGSRLKVRINEANCYIAFVCQGILPLPQDPNQPQIDKIFKQAQRFAKLNLLQRDVEVEILSSDKKSNFFGILTVNGQNYALSLLEEGLALVNYMPGRGPTVKRELYEQAEQKAKKAQKGIWDPNENISLDLIRPSASVFTPLEGKSSIEIVSYPNNNFFYAVNTDTTVLKKIEALMAKEFDPTKAEKLLAPIKRGTYCMALYSEDKKWYRGIIDRVISEDICSVLFIDYGNCEEVQVTGMRRLDQKFLKDMPAQAIKIGLAYIEMPTLDTVAGGKKLRSILQNLLDERELVALHKYSDEGITYAILLQDNESDPMKSFNAYLLKRGYAKISKRVKFPEYLHEWKDIQDKASSDQEGFWATNELAGGSDDETY